MPNLLSIAGFISGAVKCEIFRVVLESFKNRFRVDSSGGRSAAVEHSVPHGFDVLFDKLAILIDLWVDFNLVYSL